MIDVGETIDYLKIENFIHEYDFPIHDLIIPYKNDIIEQFEIEFGSYNGYNIEYKNPQLENLIYSKFLNLIKNNYIVDNPINPLKLWVYIQNNIFCKSSLHHHIPTSTLNAVFYVNIPKIGGEIKFIYNGQSLTITPKKDKIYIFPYWLPHKPLQQKDEGNRISFNIEYFCEHRPMHKKTKMVW